MVVKAYRDGAYDTSKVYELFDSSRGGHKAHDEKPIGYAFRRTIRLYRYLGHK